MSKEVTAIAEEIFDSIENYMDSATDLPYTLSEFATENDYDLSTMNIDEIIAAMKIQLDKWITIQIKAAIERQQESSEFDEA